MPIDKNATRETKRLYQNLKRVSNHNILFGHQHATEYGHGWMGDAGRSDVKSVTGSHPAVIGIDLMRFSGTSAETIEKSKQELKKNAEDTYNRGGMADGSGGANPIVHAKNLFRFGSLRFRISAIPSECIISSMHFRPTISL